MIRPKILLAVFLFSMASPLVAVRAQPAASVSVATRAGKFFRSELYFGLSRLNGVAVSDEDWISFLNETVTPRFPDGFTVVSGNGQYRHADGRIVAEPARMIIFLYTSRSKKTSRSKIEEIRAAYVKRFDQESVMRVDVPKSVSVSF